LESLVPFYALSQVLAPFVFYLVSFEVEVEDALVNAEQLGYVLGPFVTDLVVIQTQSGKNLVVFQAFVQMLTTSILYPVV